MASKIKKDDLVKIIAGKDKGKEGKVIQVIPSKHQLVIEGINILKKTRKKSDKAQGSIVDFPAPIHSSNVMLICPMDKKPTRVGFKFLKDGEKRRFSKRSSEII